jgi:hypothetical protein
LGPVFAPAISWKSFWGAAGTDAHIGDNVRLNRGHSKDQITVCFKALPGLDPSQVKQAITNRVRKSFGFVHEVTTNLPPDFQSLFYVCDFRTGASIAPH